MTGGVLIRISSMGMAFIAHLMMARLLGGDQYGTYVYAVTMASATMMFMVGGLDIILLRVVGENLVENFNKIPKKFIKWISQKLLIRCLLVLIGLLIVIPLSQVNAEWMNPFRILEPTSIIMALGTLSIACVQATGKAVLAQFLNLATGQMIFLLMLSIMALSQYDLTSTTMAWIQATSSFSVLILSIFLLIRSNLLLIDSKKKEASKWNREAKRMFWFVILGFGIAKVDILTLGHWHEMKEVGCYNIAVRMADMVSMFLTASNIYMAPRIASLYKNKEMNQLQNMITRTTRTVFAGALLVGTALIVFGPLVLSWYGKEFNKSYIPMLILICGHLVNVALGPVGYFLAMVDRSDLLIRAYTFGFIIIILLASTLIPAWGTLGAAIANTSAMIAWNLLMFYWICKYLKINTSILVKING